MTLEEFEASIATGREPAGLPLALRALWWARSGDWDRAHALAQQEKTPDGARDGAWVHAYLHRVEGDLANAGFWYRRADRAVHTGALEAEWREIAQEMLNRSL